MKLHLQANICNVSYIYSTSSITIQIKFLCNRIELRFHSDSLYSYSKYRLHLYMENWYKCSGLVNFLYNGDTEYSMGFYVQFQRNSNYSWQKQFDKHKIQITFKRLNDNMKNYMFIRNLFFLLGKNKKI